MLSRRGMALERSWDSINVRLQSRAGTEGGGTVLQEIKVARRSI